MEQKATVTFDPIEKSLTFEGELLPHQEIVHDKLVAMIGDEDTQLDIEGGFKVVANLVTYSFKVSRRPEADPAPGGATAEIPEEQE